MRTLTNGGPGPLCRVQGRGLEVHFGNVDWWVSLY